MSPALFFWLAAGASALVPAVYTGSDRGWEVSTLAFAALNLVLGAWVFFRHGRGRITAAATVGYGHAIFVGFAGMFATLVLYDGRRVQWLLEASACAYFVLALAYGVWWFGGRDASAAPLVETEGGSTADSCRWALGWSVTILAFSLPLAVNDNFVASEVAFGGLLLLAAALFVSRPTGISFMLRVVVLAAAFTFFALRVFDGFGRLELGALGVALAIIVTAGARPNRALKTGMLLATGPALLVLAQQRVAFAQSLRGTTVRDTGLESAVSPLVDFGRVMQASQEGTLGMHGLSSVFAALMSPVPRTLWPDKPDGLGAILGDLFRPELRGSGFSLLALVHGEFVYAFGLAGVLLLVPALGLGVRRLDRALNRHWPEHIDSRRDLVLLTLLAVITSGLLDLFWGGTFTFASRGIPRAVPLLLLWFLFAQQRQPRSGGRVRGRAVSEPPGRRGARSVGVDGAS